MWDFVVIGLLLLTGVFVLIHWTTAIWHLGRCVSKEGDEVRFRKGVASFLLFVLTLAFGIGVFWVSIWGVAARAVLDFGDSVEQLEKLERETNETAVWYYRNKIRIEGIEAKRGHTDAVWVTAKIKNVGDLAVQSLTFTIYFRDSLGIAIFEADNRTVSAGVIRPSHIQKFTAYVEDVPDEWSEGNVELKLTGIEFAEG